MGLLTEDYTPGQLIDAIAAALKAGDLEAAAALLILLAVKDPDSAEIIRIAVEARTL